MTIASRPCPDIGVWRAWLDREDDSPWLTEHLPDCPSCRRLTADLRDDAAASAESLSTLAPAHLPSPKDVAMARQRLAWRAPRQPGPLRGSRLVDRISTPWRIAAGGLAAAVALTLVVAFTPGGGTALASFLAQFRSQQVTPIEITPQTQGQIIQTLNALGNLGAVRGPGQNGQPARPEAAARGLAEQARTVSLTEAGQTVGFSILTPDPATLPAGVDKTPLVRVTAASQVRFTFDKSKARAYFQSIGHPEVSLPDRFDGATLVVSIPAAAVLEYGDRTSRNALIVGEAGELVVDVEGGQVSLPEMRDFLLGLPGLPPGVVSQLKQIQNWNETLPIPIPVNQVHWQSATFNGNPGLLLNDNSGTLSAGLWHAGGHLYGVAGSLKASDLKRIAESLAVR
jgi:anti-sigma factor RsiW